MSCSATPAVPLPVRVIAGRGEVIRPMQGSIASNVHYGARRRYEFTGVSMISVPAMFVIETPVILKPITFVMPDMVSAAPRIALAVPMRSR